MQTVDTPTKPILAPCHRKGPIPRKSAPPGRHRGGCSSWESRYSNRLPTRFEDEQLILLREQVAIPAIDGTELPTDARSVVGFSGRNPFIK